MFISCYLLILPLWNRVLSCKWILVDIPMKNLLNYENTTFFFHRLDLSGWFVLAKLILVDLSSYPTITKITKKFAQDWAKILRTATFHLNHCGWVKFVKLSLLSTQRNYNVFYFIEPLESFFSLIPRTWE
jgi:hypothetical protein